MGLWGALKKTINSTIGTKNIIPLDEQIANLKTLYASDEVYLEVEGSGAAVSDEGDEGIKKSAKTIKMTQDGSLKFKCDVSTSLSKNRKARIYIYKNNINIFTSKSIEENTTVVTEAIYAKRNDIFEFEFKSESYASSTDARTHYFSNITILASLKDNVVTIGEV